MSKSNARPQVTQEELKHTIDTKKSAWLRTTLAAMQKGYESNSAGKETPEAREHRETIRRLLAEHEDFNTTIAIMCQRFNDAFHKWRNKNNDDAGYDKFIDFLNSPFEKGHDYTRMLGMVLHAAAKDFPREVQLHGNEEVNNKILKLLSKIETPSSLLRSKELNTFYQTLKKPSEFKGTVYTDMKSYLADWRLNENIRQGRAFEGKKPGISDINRFAGELGANAKGIAISSFIEISEKKVWNEKMAELARFVLKDLDLYQNEMKTMPENIQLNVKRGYIVKFLWGQQAALIKRLSELPGHINSSPKMLMDASNEIILAFKEKMLANIQPEKASLDKPATPTQNAFTKPKRTAVNDRVHHDLEKYRTAMEEVHKRVASATLHEEKLPIEESSHKFTRT